MEHFWIKPTPTEPTTCKNCGILYGSIEGAYLCKGSPKKVKMTL